MPAVVRQEGEACVREVPGLPLAQQVLRKIHAEERDLPLRKTRVAQVPDRQLVRGPGLDRELELDRGERDRDAREPGHELDQDQKQEHAMIDPAVPQKLVRKVGMPRLAPGVGLEQLCRDQ